MVRSEGGSPPAIGASRFDESESRCRIRSPVQARRVAAASNHPGTIIASVRAAKAARETRSAFRPALPATSIDETGEHLKAIALPKGIVVVS